MLGIDKPDTFSDYTTHVNAMAMYRPRGSTRRPQTEVITWQTSLKGCITAARRVGEVWVQLVAATSSSPTVEGPRLGPLLQCVAERLAAARRHHKGLLVFYPYEPANRYLP